MFTAFNKKTNETEMFDDSFYSSILMDSDWEVIEFNPNPVKRKIDSHKFIILKHILSELEEKKIITYNQTKKIIDIINGDDNNE